MYNVMKIVVIFVTIVLFYFNITATKDYYFNDNCQLPNEMEKEIKSYQGIVDEIIHKIVNGPFKGDVYKGIMNMTAKFEKKLGMFETLQQASIYMHEEMYRANLENIRIDTIEAADYTRGSEYLYITWPLSKRFKILGLGYSFSTSPQGVTGEGLIITTYHELENLKRNEAEGKIIIFVPEGNTTLHEITKYCILGVGKAAIRGAVGFLMRSKSQHLFGDAHVGRYLKDLYSLSIPAALIDQEAVEFIETNCDCRRNSNGTPAHFRIIMNEKILVPSNIINVAGELMGSDHINNSIVAIICHVDSWDSCVGMMDDGGSFISWKAVEYLKKMGYRPERTIQSILLGGDRTGHMGMAAFIAQHIDEEATEFDVFLETDIGSALPTGFSFKGNADSECIFRRILKLTSVLQMTNVFAQTSKDPDISDYTDRGFPGASLISENEPTLWNTNNKFNLLQSHSEDLDKVVAVFAAVSYVLADLSIDLPKNVSLKLTQRLYNGDHYISLHGVVLLTEIILIHLVGN